MHIVISVLACGLAVAAFTFFDVQGFGVLVQSFNSFVTLEEHRKPVLRAYRIMQVMFQFSIYGLLLSAHLYGALAGFAFAHWAFGCDYFYYVIRGEDYMGYTITWFNTSLPSLVFRLIGKPFTGHALRWIGPTACAIGLGIAAVFA